MSIEEAADKYEKANTGIYPEVGQTSIRDAFIDGYNLCREQMMKEAVEGKICGDASRRLLKCGWLEHKFGEPGDKVKLIIVKED